MLEKCLFRYATANFHVFISNTSNANNRIICNIEINSKSKLLQKSLILYKYSQSQRKFTHFPMYPADSIIQTHTLRDDEQNIRVNYHITDDLLEYFGWVANLFVVLEDIVCHPWMQANSRAIQRRAGDINLLQRIMRYFSYEG